MSAVAKVPGFERCTWEYATLGAAVRASVRLSREWGMEEVLVVQHGGGSYQGYVLHESAAARMSYAKNIAVVIAT